MGAIWRGCKRYFLEYESEQKICGKYRYSSGDEANSITVLKRAIKRIRQQKAEYNHRNFVIYDSFAECEPGEHVPAVYKEA